MADNEYPEKQFLEYVVKAVVDNPEDVRVERTVDEGGVLLTIAVNPKDMGQIIGRGGKTIDKAIRPLVSLVGMKNNARVSVKLLEPEGSERPERSERPRREVSEDNGGDGEIPPMMSNAVSKVIDDLKEDLEQE